ncbi:MAG TPA: hypothetical protein VE291_10635 [Terracidiphilus sp.]|jgi:hypothetical protein|nr:hypothetical protein [Terracidiphilus sp.]
MSLNGYDGAFELATNERAEIRLEIERLLNRGEMLDKLLECLAPFVSSPEPVEAAEESRSEQHHEQHEHEHQHQS